jgi:hypothetical protein
VIRSIVATLVATSTLSACSTGGNDSGGSASVPTSARVAIPSARENAGSLQGYYLAKLTTKVGSGLPESSFCFRFKSSGTWSNTGSEGFSGTYLISGKELFASAVWLPSPAIYMSLQGSVGANQGSGTFIISSANGEVSGGGYFSMMVKQSKSCA